MLVLTLEQWILTLLHNLPVIKEDYQLKLPFWNSYKYKITNEQFSFMIPYSDLSTAARLAKKSVAPSRRSVLM